MSNQIHPQAIVGKNVVIGKNNIISAFVILEDNVVVGNNNYFHSSCQIKKNTQIGNDNIFHSFCVIGDNPQDISFQEKKTCVTINNNNVFREGVTVHRATKKETVIDSNCYLMVNSHIAHDCIVKEGVIIANNSLLAGHVSVDAKVFISGNCAVHQFVSIGEGVMIGGLAKVVDDVPPYVLVEGGGNAHYRGLNLVGLKRNGVSRQEIFLIKNYYNDFFQQKKNYSQKIATLQQQEKYQNNFYIEKINSFILKERKRNLVGEK